MKFWYRTDAKWAADRHGLDPQLVEAVCMQESSGLTNAYRYEPLFYDRYLKGKPEWAGQNPRRISASYGLMQVMLPTAFEMGMDRTDAPESLFVPKIGLRWGCAVLAERMQWAKHDVASALASYNGGKTADNAQDRFPRRNQEYADKVLRWLQRVQAGETDD